MQDHFFFKYNSFSSLYFSEVKLQIEFQSNAICHITMITAQQTQNGHKNKFFILHYREIEGERRTPSRGIEPATLRSTSGL